MTSVGRSRRLAPTSALNVRADSEICCNRECSSAAVASHVVRWALAFAVFAALTACGQQASLTPLSNATAGAAAAKPAITLESNPSSVVMGHTTTLKWNASNAQSCTASGGWSGTQPTSGTLSTDPLTATTSYTLTCTGAGGSVAQSAQVVVTQPAPSVSLAASPTTISSGASSTLTWSATDATECMAS